MLRKNVYLFWPWNIFRKVIFEKVRPSRVWPTSKLRWLKSLRSLFHRFSQKWIILLRNTYFAKKGRHFFRGPLYNCYIFMLSPTFYLKDVCFSSLKIVSKFVVELNFFCLTVATDDLDKNSIICSSECFRWRFYSGLVLIFLDFLVLFLYFLFMNSIHQFKLYIR